MEIFNVEKHDLILIHHKMPSHLENNRNGNAFMIPNTLSMQ